MNTSDVIAISESTGGRSVRSRMGRDIFIQAYAAMRHDLRKTVLTMLGMAWGIATVVLLLAYGEGFGRAVRNIWEAFGATAVGIYPGRTSQQAGGNKAGTAIRFTNDDMELMRNVVPLARHMSRIGELDATLQSGPRTFPMHVFGVDPSMADIWALGVAEGRFLDEADNMSHARVVVLGTEAKDKLFSGIPALGESIRINGASFQVVGILKARMQEADSNDNRVVYAPYNSMDTLRDNHYLSGMWLDSIGLDHNKMSKSIRDALALQHGFKSSDERAVFVFDAQKQLEQFSIITIALKVLLAFIGTITLGIGGVGLMNMMLVSVTQRTREIGVEKALGARKRTFSFNFSRKLW
jgi:putative ABC transport system permease protein